MPNNSEITSPLMNPPAPFEAVSPSPIVVVQPAKAESAVLPHNGVQSSSRRNFLKTGLITAGTVAAAVAFGMRFGSKVPDVISNNNGQSPADAPPSPTPTETPQPTATQEATHPAENTVKHYEVKDAPKWFGGVDIKLMTTESSTGKTHNLDFTDPVEGPRNIYEGIIEMLVAQKKYGNTKAEVQSYGDKHKGVFEGVTFLKRLKQDNPQDTDPNTDARRSPPYTETITRDVKLKEGISLLSIPLGDPTPGKDIEQMYWGNNSDTSPMIAFGPDDNGKLYFVGTNNEYNKESVAHSLYTMMLFTALAPQNSGKNSDRERLRENKKDGASETDRKGFFLNKIFELGNNEYPAYTPENKGEYPVTLPLFLKGDKATQTYTYCILKNK